ncbi:MAG: metallophosphoesterase [Candidatus Omnitrophica bacterium]|nr:metallophosphoesterase [Candidatus Omnitrophota bacterium]
MKRRTKTLLAVVILAMLVYSFLPLVRFWMTGPVPSAGKNEDAVAKLADNKGPYFSFIVMGDNHAGLFLNDAATLKEIWHMNREDRFRKAPIDFVINVGDVSWDGERTQFEAYKKLEALIKYPVVSALGNHDDRTLFKEFCGEKEFAFTDRNSLFIVLDNEAGELSDAQFVWFEGQLKRGIDYDNIFVIMHKPPFSPYQQDWYNMDDMPWAYHFRKLCAQYKVRMVFCGHKHMFKHERFDGVDYIVTGGGGMVTEIPDSDGGFLHYVRVKVNHDYVTYEVRRVSPPLWEYPVYYIWKELVYWCRDLYGSGYIFGTNAKILQPRTVGFDNDEYWFKKRNVVQ